MPLQFLFQNIFRAEGYEIIAWKICDNCHRPGVVMVYDEWSKCLCISSWDEGGREIQMWILDNFASFLFSQLSDGPCFCLKLVCVLLFMSQISASSRSVHVISMHSHVDGTILCLLHLSRRAIGKMVWCPLEFGLYFNSSEYTLCAQWEYAVLTKLLD